MVRTPWSTAAMVGLLVAGIGGTSGCGDDGATPIDAAVDAAIDAEIDAPPGPCGTELLLTGEYIDWDSTIMNFDGVEDAVWKIVEPAGGAMATTAPNGRIILCIPPLNISQIDVTQGQYLPARFVADPAVFRPAQTTFTLRGLKTAVAAARIAALGENLVPGSAHVLVYKIGAPIPLSLTPAINQRSYVSDGDDDITWTMGDTGTLTLFPSRPVGTGTATLTSTSSFTGPATLPLAGDRFTLTVIR